MRTPIRFTALALLALSVACTAAEPITWAVPSPAKCLDRTTFRPYKKAGIQAPGYWRISLLEVEPRWRISLLEVEPRCVSGSVWLRSNGCTKEGTALSKLVA